MQDVRWCQAATVIDLEIDRLARTAHDSTEEIVGAKSAEHKTKEFGPASFHIGGLLTVTIDGGIDQKTRPGRLRSGSLKQSDSTGGCWNSRVPRTFHWLAPGRVSEHVVTQSRLIALVLGFIKNDCIVLVALRLGP